MGLSQGGLIARYVVERCDLKGGVRNIVTFGAPHMGVAASPHCFSGMFCDMVNYVLKSMVYFQAV
jgi:palmitoyl-protein thioesterase